MTFEIRTSIEPRDITAVEFECKVCGTRTIRKINEKFSTPMMCGNCSAVWFIAGGPEADQVAQFLRILEHHSKHDFPYVLRFHVPNMKEDE